MTRRPLTESARRLALAVALLVAVAGCTGSASDRTSTTPAPGTTSSTPATVVTPPTTAPLTTTSAPPPTSLPPAGLPRFPDDDEPIPIDAGVRIGTLDNGLRYYIRANDRPGQRAQLRLAIDAGSVLEDDDQIGAAHFVEHLMFNGTEAFPKNELILTLQRFGAEFGPEINAFTSFDETVYELELPTDDPRIVETAFDVLFEWADRALLEPEEVEAERGVLLEEWRLRSQSADGRYFEGVAPLLLEGTDYEERGPLAGPDEVASITTEALRRFYEEWYRPELMALIAVGDFDPDVVEELIRERFGALANDPAARPRFTSTTEAFAEPKYFVLADPEVTAGFAELNYPMPAVEPGTIGAAREELALDLAFDMIVTRLAEDALRGDAPFFDASFAANPFVDAQRTPGTGALADTADLAAAVEALLEETRRALLHGFAPAELARAVTEARRLADLAFDGRGTKQDVQFAEEYLRHYLAGSPIPSAEDAHALTQRLLDEMTADQVARTFRATVGATQPLVIIVGPEGADLPDEAALAATVERVAAAELPPRPAQDAARDVLLEAPDPAGVSSRVDDGPLGEVDLVLANGARVILKETDIGQDRVAFGAVSPGGWSLLDAADVVEAQLASAVVIDSGVGPVDQVELERFLAGKAVTVRPFIGEVEEGFFGAGSTADLETLFQLVNLYMTRPRFDPVALAAVVDELRPRSAAPEADPSQALLAALVAARFEGDVRYSFLPPVEDLDTFDLERSEEVYRARFADAADFVFVLAGDFEPAAAEDLARRYLGTLPGGPGSESFVDTQPEGPDGVTETRVEAGRGELAAVAVLYENDLGLDPALRLQAELLELILQQRLTEVIREELSASYSPFATVEVLEEPDQAIQVFISVSADPGRLGEVSAAALGEIADIRANGPTADELAIAQEQYIRDIELVSNQFWVDTLLFYATGDEDPAELGRRRTRIEEVTVDDMRSLAVRVLPADRYIEVRLVPIGFAG